MITYNKLNIEEARQVYDTYLVRDFPAAEVKPFKTIAALMERGQYRCYSFYEDQQLVGYAFFCDDRAHTCSLLDYYAIMEDKRGQGYGQVIVELLREIHSAYEAVVLESEDPAFSSDEQDRLVRVRRLRFYKRCGLHYAGFTCNAFDVDFLILLIPCKSCPDAVWARAKMDEIYRDLVREPYFTQKVHIHEISARAVDF